MMDTTIPSFLCVCEVMQVKVVSVCVVLTLERLTSHDGAPLSLGAAVCPGPALTVHSSCCSCELRRTHCFFVFVIFFLLHFFYHVENCTLCVNERGRGHVNRQHTTCTCGVNVLYVCVTFLLPFWEWHGSFLETSSSAPEHVEVLTNSLSIN